MVKVSIIVPVYNVEKYLARCLDSLINQTLSDIEIIVVNDGSPDNSDKIIKEYKKKDKRIVSLKKENGGLSSARNFGLSKAKGEYIAYVDSDDWVDVTMFEEMYNKAIEDKCDIVVCDFYKSYDDGNDISISGMVDYSKVKKRNFIMSSPCAWNKIYKKEIISIDNFPEGMLYEDFASTPLLIKKASNIGYVNKPLYFYYIRDNSIMNELEFKPKFYDILKAANILTDTILKDSNYYDYLLEFEYLIIDNLLRDTYFRLKNVNGSDKLLKDITTFIEENYPNFMNNKYIKQRGLKHRIITYLIYKRQCKLLNLISRGK